MAEDKTLRLILGALLLLIGIPGLWMAFGMMSYGGMMSGGFGIFSLLAVISLLALGAFLVIDGLKGKR